MTSRPLFALTGCLVVAWASTGLDAGRSAPAERAAAQRAVIDRYCVSCHNDRLKTAGLTLAPDDLANVAARSDVWEKVVRKLRTRMMPPPGRPRPDEETY